jgi:hypothetical protein
MWRCWSMGRKSGRRISSVASEESGCFGRLGRVPHDRFSNRVTPGAAGFLILSQVFEGPGRWARSRCLETMPSAPSPQARAEMAAPSPSGCSLYWIPPDLISGGASRGKQRGVTPDRQAWFSTFLEKAFVSLVNRRVCIRTFGSGLL